MIWLRNKLFQSMKSILNPFLLLGFLLILMFSFSALSAQTTNLSSSLPKIDGKINDWKLPLSYFDKSTRITYSFRNTADFVYFVYRTDDTLLSDKILRTGIELRIEREGVEGDLKIFFPEPNRKNKELAHHDEKGGRPDLLEHLKLANQHIGVDGFRAAKGRVSNPTDFGLMAAVDLSEGQELIYEIQLPIHELFPNGLKTRAGTKLEVEFVIPAMEGKSEKKNKGQHEPSMRPGGKGSGMGKGGGKMGGSKGKEGSPILSREQKVKQEFVLK